MVQNDTLDAALAELERFGPELSTGFTNHAPMAAEALCALRRADAVAPLLERYRPLLLPRERAQETIAPHEAKALLGRNRNASDWEAFFVAQQAQKPWRMVLGEWAVLLAPGISAAAMHGAIRTGHAARALTACENTLRLHELAAALGYWASCYRALPQSPHAGPKLPPREAIMAVPRIPPAERHHVNSISQSLLALDGFARFAPVIHAADVDTPDALSEITETFARVFLSNTQDPLSAIVFIHGVTGAATLRSILPLLSKDESRAARAFAWQGGAALYAVYATTEPLRGDIAAPAEDHETLIDLAIESGDEHAVKFTEVCLREHALHPSPVYLAAARQASGILAAT